MFFYFARQSFKESVIFQFALPDNNQLPTKLFQSSFRVSIPGDIPLEFFLPEFHIRGGSCCLSASRMPMPETSPHLDNSSIFRENNIRMPRQIFYMKPKAESMPKEKRANHELWCRVIRSDSTHISTAFFGRDAVHYFSSSKYV